jgi:gamma-glutamylputrescine oxidase
MQTKLSPYWLEVPLIKGETNQSFKRSEIIIIGSGLSGVSCGYFLQKEGFNDVTIIDYKPEQSASYRNCGHILYGTVESMKAFSEIHGAEKARELWDFSVQICHLVRETIQKNHYDVDYKQDGYLCVAISEAEDRECRESTELLNSMGFKSEYQNQEKTTALGFKNVFGARFEEGSAQAHPVKFRNALLKNFLSSGGKYYSDKKILKIKDTHQGVILSTGEEEFECDAAIIAANAYSPIFSDFFNQRRLIEPFRGQIITSKPLKTDLKIKFPHSFDHGYEYALVTEDNRLMIGGWRHNSPTKELGTYSLETNAQITEGLKRFVSNHYAITEEIEWEFSWSGIMGASKTSLPFIGPTNSDRIYACGGYTGHGFSWAHGSAQLLAKIMAGKPLPGVSKYFNPKLL